MVRRVLGEGRWDKILKRRMTELSVADNYNDAKEEWLATGQVWWAGNGEMPNWVANASNGAGNCLCGHNVVYHFEIVNTENGTTECVGSDHINSYLIMRQIAEDMNVEVDTITDEQVQEWIKVRVGSMKEEAWWAENGDNFRMMFNKIKELDLWENVHTKDPYYCGKHRMTLYRKTLRKKSSGAFGSPHYRMASIVWRWNHPDNPKAQVNTTGIPSDKVMQDLALLFVLSDGKIKAMNEEKARLKEAELATIAFDEEQRRRREARHAERLERERLRQEQWERERPAREAREALERERRRIAQEKQKEIKNANNIANLSSRNFAFEEQCMYYNIPVFDISFATNDWEIEFLSGMKKTLTNKQMPSNRQVMKLRELLTNPPTEKQIKFLRDLGYEGEIPTKLFASRKINELKEDKLNEDNC